MSVTVKSPHDLKALLAIMKSAKAKNTSMAVWDKDIRAVEEAIATIEALGEIRNSPAHKSKERA